MIVTPTLLAYLVLLIWPVVIWQLYRRLPAAQALIWSILGGYMALPELVSFDLPVVPALNKSTLPALSAAMISGILLQRKLNLMPQSKVARGLLVMFVVTPFVTVLTNQDPLVFSSGVVVPGMRLYDSVAAVVTQSLYVLPFFLARRDLATPEAILTLLQALGVATLLYALPIFYESLMSPQLHRMFYGFFQHDFSQAIRFGGYRPFVFMPHGLWVAFFAALCLMAIAGLLRVSPSQKRPALRLALGLALVLVLLCKSFGPAAYAFLALPIILFLPARAMVYLASCMAALVILYPLLRGAKWIPVAQLIDFVAGLSYERALSLGFRLQNEEELLTHAAERAWFGWGGYGRNFLHDPMTGEILNIADGAWVIRIGIFGWLGFWAEFGLLALPIWLVARAIWAKGAQVTLQAAVLCLMLGFNLLDLLPNATLVPLTWLMAGALLGYAETLTLAPRQSPLLREPAPKPRRTLI